MDVCVGVMVCRDRCDGVWTQVHVCLREHVWTYGHTTRRIAAKIAHGLPHPAMLEDRDRSLQDRDRSAEHRAAEEKKRRAATFFFLNRKIGIRG